MEKPNIRNYTSSVNADDSVTRIEKKLEQVEFAEVFMPYMLVGKCETVYNRLNSDGFKALNATND